MRIKSTKILENITTTSFFLLGLLFFVSCVSDSEEDLIPIGSNPDGRVTFQVDIRPIFQNACNECHSDPPRNGAPQPLVTLEQIRSNVENRNLLGRINSLSAPMPPSGLLPENTRQLIQEWVDGGFVNQ